MLDVADCVEENSESEGLETTENVRDFGHWRFDDSYDWSIYRLGNQGKVQLTYNLPRLGQLRQPPPKNEHRKHS